jgi:lipopolysaccharide biosynthesis protein
MTQTDKKVRPIAFYLPQFHPIAENDEWWGRGFTEWTNTAKAKPLFRGHYQPHVPADLGFYDLRLSESREQQAAMAARYGIEAFCYYHYWFGGRRLLERPFDEVLASGSPKLPFCLCWANQTWTGVWHGSPRRVLVEQTYPGESDHRAHFEYLTRAFADDRYVRVDGQPLFLIYSPGELPNAERTLDSWRERSVKVGLRAPYFVAVVWEVNATRPPAGFDGQILQHLPERADWYPWSRPIEKIRRYVTYRLGHPTVKDYASSSREMLPAQLNPEHSFPVVVPNWDNSPRSGRRGLCLRNSTPQLFGEQVARAVRLLSRHDASKRLLFIKSWNEWAEGNHLEPDLRYGHQYLEALQGALVGA